MEIAEASEIAESCGCFLKYDDTMKVYRLYVGFSCAYIKPDDLMRLETRNYKLFLINFMSQEGKDLIEFGGPTKH